MLVPPGRGAPEIDVLEYGILGAPATPQYVHTMQMAPVAPLYTTWMTPINTATRAPEGGQGMRTGFDVSGCVMQHWFDLHVQAVCTSCRHR